MTTARIITLLLAAILLAACQSPTAPEPPVCEMRWVKNDLDTGTGLDSIKMCVTISYQRKDTTP